MSNTWTSGQDVLNDFDDLSDFYDRNVPQTWNTQNPLPRSTRGRGRKIVDSDSDSDDAPLPVFGRHEPRKIDDEYQRELMMAIRNVCGPGYSDKVFESALQTDQASAGQSHQINGTVSPRRTTYSYIPKSVESIFTEPAPAATSSEMEPAVVNHTLKERNFTEPYSSSSQTSTSRSKSSQDCISSISSDSSFTRTGKSKKHRKNYVPLNVDVQLPPIGQVSINNEYNQIPVKKQAAKTCLNPNAPKFTSQRFIAKDNMKIVKDDFPPLLK